MKKEIKLLKQVIDGMSISEKGYFKKYIKLDVVNYRQLEIAFNALDGKENYDFPFSKDTLYLLQNTLLKCLSQFYASEEREIRGILNKIELLAEKNLYSQAEKLVQKAKKISQKEKHSSLYIECCNWEIALLSQKPPSDALLNKYEMCFESLMNHILYSSSIK